MATVSLFNGNIQETIYAKIMKNVYEVMMILLVILTIMTIWTDNAYNSTVNWIVWIVFFVDFSVRFLTSKKKWNFIKQNPFLTIAIIPLDQFFKLHELSVLFTYFELKQLQNITRPLF